MNPILIISGPSAGGKTTVADAILAVDSRFTYLRSATTREPRGDGKDDEYIYYTPAEFEKAVKEGIFAEHMTYGGHRYGTRNEELKRALDEGKIPLLVLDLAGVASLGMHPDYDACSIYIYDELDVIERRLDERYISRGGNDERLLRTIEGRKKNNIADYLAIDRYSPFIYAFIHNGSTVGDCRDKALAYFTDFLSGKAADDVNKSVATKTLTRLARAKMISKDEV